MTELQFQTVDVFTTTRFGGNPLAVVLDARGLSAMQMQAIAQEFNYSESTFILPPDNPAHTAHVRIFTPTQEVPFAGHPNVGTAFVLANLGEIFGRSTSGPMTFEEAAGLVKVEITGSGAGTLATITAPEALSMRALPAAVDLPACVGLDEADFQTEPHPSLVASVGLPFAFARVADLATLGRARPVTDAFVRSNENWGIPDLGLSIMLYTPDPGAPDTVRARMFAPLDNIPEDPATGSASGALGGLLAHFDARQEGVFALTINQGFEMGRPSTIEVTSTKQAGQVRSVRIAGRCVPVMAGTITI